jgi:hypothetical protein
LLTSDEISVVTVTVAGIRRTLRRLPAVMSLSARGHDRLHRYLNQGPALRGQAEILCTQLVNSSPLVVAKRRPKPAAGVRSPLGMKGGAAEVRLFSADGAAAAGERRVPSFEQMYQRAKVRDPFARQTCLWLEV